MQSIADNGFRFPIVVIYGPVLGGDVIIDGCYRCTIFKDCLGAAGAPVIALDEDMKQRMDRTGFSRATLARMGRDRHRAPSAIEKICITPDCRIEDVVGVKENPGKLS